MRKYIFAVTAAALFLSMAPSLHAYWIWTPQTGTWINPKWAVKDTPQEQFDWAMKFFKAKDYKKAVEEFLRLVRFYPQAELAAESQYYAGQAYEALEEYEQAFYAYQKGIETYPFSKRLDEMTEREYQIAGKFYAGEKVRLWGIPTFPSVYKAIEMYQKVVDNAPYGKYADQSLFKIGECYKKARDYQQARLAFQKLVDEHPESKLSEEANFQVGLCASQASLKPSYDQSVTDEALKSIEDFAKRHPESKLTAEADKMHQSLREKKAESDYTIAEFYWKQKWYDSAGEYYKNIVTNFPDTETAKKAEERLKMIERKQKK
ncbi:MAG: outer membrane protein assembly factor BamD [Candidatus Omnitrophota bacterium]|jgi:outer membrane protein assembly factor BamD